METKRKRGRPRKVQLPEEIKEIIKEIPTTNNMEPTIREEQPRNNEGYTCDFPIAYKTFCDQDYLRCREGMTVNGYTITGDHYYFLNYYQLMNLNSVKKAGTSRLYTFPDFYVAQYQWFHYLELCKRLLKNACLMKARGIGFSEIMASSAACSYNCF